MTYKVNIFIEKNESGYSASFPEIAGYQVQGDSLDMVFDNLKEAVKQDLEKINVKTNDKVDQPIWEVAEDIIQDMTEEEINQLPIDGAEQHDHYIYGTPKIER